MLLSLLVGQATAPVVRQAPLVKVPPLLAAGTPAPDFFATTTDGKTVTLRSLRGKVVVLDFWATWCGPCMVSMPGLQAIYKEAKPQGVVVLSVDTWDEKAAFAKWVGETPYDFTFVRDPAEGGHDAIRAASIARRLYHAPGIPTQYVIGRQGKVIQGFVGSGNEANLVAALAKVGVRATVPKA